MVVHTFLQLAAIAHCSHKYKSWP